MSTALYRHNHIAYEAACSMMRRSGKAAVIHPTGTGKSFIAFRLCEDHLSETICWLSPSEYIFHTQQENWRRAGGSDCANIHFLTYAKLMLMEKTELMQIRPDYIVLDEFHRCGARMWGQGVEHLLSLFPKVPLLGLSATNVRYLDNQRDMADELFDGCIASQMTLGEAIVRGILNPPKYVRSIFSYRKDLEQYETRIRTARSKAVRAEAEKELEALRRALEQAEGMEQIFYKHLSDRAGKYLVFCADYNHMKEMIAKVPEWFAKIDAAPHVYSVYSEDPGTSKEFADFKSDRSDHLKLLFCIDMLNEGIHVADVSGVILLRPTVSPIIYKQQIGRALSAGEKQNAVIFDVVQNIENLCSIGAVEEEMRVAVEAYRRKGREVEIINCRFRVIDEVSNCVQLFQKLEGTLSASWDLMYAAAERYYQQTGGLEISKRYVTPEGLSLGQWLDTQRRVYTKKVSGILTETQVQRLNAIGMRWQDAREAAWEKYYAKAEAYYHRHGDLLVPAREECDGVALGRWIAQLRTAKKGNCGLSLTPEREAALNQIGMVWDVMDYFWEQNYASAKQYYEEKGHLDVPIDYTNSAGIHLGAWILKNRSLRAELTKERIEKLNAIGMSWEPKRDAIWESTYRAACTYFTEYGHLNVPAAYVTKEGCLLGKWIRRQREAYYNHSLSEEHRRKLEKLGMDWQLPAQSKWEQTCDQADEYFQAHGNLQVPSGFQTQSGFHLGAWIARQRKRKAQLADWQIQRLNKIGMVWK